MMSSLSDSSPTDLPRAPDAASRAMLSFFTLRVTVFACGIALRGTERGSTALSPRSRRPPSHLAHTRDFAAGRNAVRAEKTRSSQPRVLLVAAGIVAQKPEVVWYARVGVEVGK